MTLSPTERDKVLRMVAEHIAGEFRAAAGGDLETLIVLPIAAAAAHIGKTPKWTARHLPTVRDAPGKYGVRLSDLRAHIEAHLSPPAARPAGAVPPAPAGLSHA